MSLTKAQAAFDDGDFDGATEICLEVLDKNVKNVPAFLLAARSMLAKGSFQASLALAATPVLDAEVEPHIKSHRDALEDLVVDGIVGWAAAIEAGDAQRSDVKQLQYAASFYGENFDRFVAEIIGIERGLASKVTCVDAFRDMIAEKRGSANPRVDAIRARAVATEPVKKPAKKGATRTASAKKAPARKRAAKKPPAKKSAARTRR
jgi:hypothetical protein